MGQLRDIIMEMNKGAAATFRVLLGASIITAGFAVALTLLYLWATGAPLRPAVILVATLGVGATVLVAGALMGLIYYSAQSGHDSRIAPSRRNDKHSTPNKQA